MCPTSISRAVPPPADPPARVGVAELRREQIVQAAVGIIVEQGLHNLSLSRIEQRAGMKRGQLTYYFKTWENILLAVFDRLLLVMCQKLHEASGESCPGQGKVGLPDVWESVQRLLKTMLERIPLGDRFHALQYTFLAQITHREDFRQKLASLYEDWRTGLAAHWRVSAKPGSPLANNVSPRTVASFVQAIVHGLQVQLSADPEAFDRAEMLTLCVGVLAPLFAPAPAEAGRPTPRRNGAARRAKELPDE